jgi:hypothetical protein
VKHPAGVVAYEYGGGWFNDIQKVHLERL